MGEERSAVPVKSMTDRGRSAIIVLGALVLVVLGAFAWSYYLERTACFDSAFFSWLMIQAGAPISVLGRIGSWVAQLLPVALIQGGAPLSVVLRAYSVSFILFHALVFYLVAFRLKDRRGTVALPLALTAAFHYMFYYGISELYQGLSLTVLLWVLIRRTWETGASKWWFVAALALNAFISTYHQLLVLPLLFVLVYEGLEAKRWHRAPVWLLAAVLVLWYVLRIALMTKSSYEESRMPKAEDLWLYAFKLNELNSTAYLLMVWTKFKALLLVMAVAGVLALRRRAWLQLLWALAFSTGFLVLILIVDRDGMAPVIYENYYPVIGLVWAIVFATEFDLLEGAWRKAAFGSLVLSCGLGLLQIHRGHYRMTDHVAYNQRLTAYRAMHGVRKSMVRSHNFPWAYSLVHWAVPFESALASGVHGPQQAASLFVSDNTALLDTVADRKEQFLGPDWAPLWFWIPDLDRRYFDLPMDVGYSWCNRLDRVQVPNGVRIIGPTEPWRLVPDRFTVVPLWINNPGPGLLSSCGPEGKPVQFVYRLLRPDGSLYQESSERSSMETDVVPGTSYIQGLVIERPLEQGTYTVEAWLVHDGTPLGPEVRFNVVADRWPL